MGRGPLGGPKIIDSVADGLPVPGGLRHSWDSLRTSCAVSTKPRPRMAPGLVATFGPGFFASTVTGTWQAHE
ncbi:hypothetical protein [Streptomyces sp. CA2R106]|uniref:hypothetical protein n=1 Tax=Streptomyces sp. CA2R106 TaxID=3120153 RepID=UPI003009BFCF